MPPKRPVAISSFSMPTSRATASLRTGNFSSIFTPSRSVARKFPTSPNKANSASATPTLSTAKAKAASLPAVGKPTAFPTSSNSITTVGSRKPGEPGQGQFWVWGWDEITWFSQQSEADRNHWLEYAWNWIRTNDPAGYLQMPGARVITGAADGKRWYAVNNPSPATPNGFAQENTIRKIWANDK